MKYSKNCKKQLIAFLFSSVALVLAGCATNGNNLNRKPEQASAVAPLEVTVKQDPGKIVYWVLPGPRRLSKKVFGTPAHPKMLATDKIKAAENMVAAKKMPPPVPELLKKMPILVGVPLMARKFDQNGNWVLKMPTPFSDRGMIVSGSFDVTYHDVVKKDPPGPPMKTPDSVDVHNLQFTDPAGNHYRIVFHHVVKPPFPGYETDGGVMIDGWTHGSTGTGSPLMPEERTIAAFWGVGDVYINGKLAQPHRVMHMMTTEVVRDKNYKLALDEDLPLAPGQRIISNQTHHTHFIVLPIVPEKGKGPVFSPLKTAFKLPNGMVQPFIHVMYEQDEVIR